MIFEQNTDSKNEGLAVCLFSSESFSLHFIWIHCIFLI